MTWRQLREEIRSLAKKIDYRPDVIVGIVRGGLVPARLLSSELNVKDMYSLTIKKIKDQRKVMSDILEDMQGKHILLVEDMLETGNSLVAAKKYLEGRGAVVKTACLYVMPISGYIPDFSLKEIQEIPIFPWE